MPLNEEPIEINWPETHYINVRKVGPFSGTARQAWEALHKNLPEVVNNLGTPTSFFSLYQLAPEMVYMAGVSVAVR